jgi:hypothetical protein
VLCIFILRVHLQHSAQHRKVFPLQNSFGFSYCTASLQIKLHRFKEELLGILHRRSAQWTRRQPMLSHLFHAHPAASMG